MTTSSNSEMGAEGFGGQERSDPGMATMLRISDADRNGTLRRLHNAVALGLIDIDEFEERSAAVSQARLHSNWPRSSRTCQDPARSSPPRPTGSNCGACSAL